MLTLAKLGWGRRSERALVRRVAASVAVCAFLGCAAEPSVDAPDARADPDLGVPLCDQRPEPDPVLPGVHGIENRSLLLDLVGDGVPADAYLPDSGQDLPVVLWLNGGNVEGARYAWLGTVLASHGYAVVIARSGLPNARTAPAMLRALRAAGAFARVDTDRVVVAGHSHGGLTALCSVEPMLCDAESNAELRASLAGVLGLMSHAQPPGDLSIERSIDIGGVPVLLAQGTRDGIASVAEVTATYERLRGAADRYLVTMAGVNHYQVVGCLDLERDFYTLDLPAEVAHATALERAARVVLGFLAEVFGDAAFPDQVAGEPGIQVLHTGPD